jgi:hypothetical protein
MGKIRNFSHAETGSLLIGKFNTEFSEENIRSEFTTIMESMRYAYFKEKRLRLSDLRNRLLGAATSILSFGFCRSPASVGLPE